MRVKNTVYILGLHAVRFQNEGLTGLSFNEIISCAYCRISTGNCIINFVYVNMCISLYKCNSIKAVSETGCKDSHLVEKLFE